jgi:hypothetical protein
MKESLLPSIPFTQFILPNGRQEATSISVDDPDVAKMATEILETGRYRFECEVLMTGEVSVTCADREEEIDISIEICRNGPEVPAAVAKMVRDAYAIVSAESVEPK